MEYILHIGLPKTGSSSLQNVLVNNRNILRRHGVIYPKTGIPHLAKKHEGLFWVMQGIDPVLVGMENDWVKRFHAETADADVCILSDECFWRLPDPEIFTTLVSRDRTRVVMYVREPVSHVVSMYRQKVKSSNMTKSLWDFVQSYKPSFFNAAKRWEAVFGSESVMIRPNDINCGRWDIVSDFANLIGVKELADTLPIHIHKMNLGIAGNLLFVKRVLNLFITLEEGRNRAFRKEIRELEKLDPAFLGKIPVDQRTVDLILHQCQEYLEGIEKHYGVSIRLRQKPIIAPPCPDLGYLGRDFERIHGFAREKNGHFAQFLGRMAGVFAKVH